VPPIAYKLRSLSDLRGLILQVAGTPTHGILVSVSAGLYTQILVSDCIGACPYHPFSSCDIINNSCNNAKNCLNVSIPRACSLVHLVSKYNNNGPSLEVHVTAP